MVALPMVRPDSVVGRLNQLVPTRRLKEVPDGRNVKEPEVAMVGFVQSASKKERRMFAVLAVTGVPARKPRVVTFLR